MKKLGLKGNVKFIALSTYTAVEKFGEIVKGRSNQLKKMQQLIKQ